MKGIAVCLLTVLLAVVLPSSASPEESQAARQAILARVERVAKAGPFQPAFTLKTR